MKKLLCIIICLSILSIGTPAISGKIKHRCSYEDATQCTITLFFLDQCDCYGLLLERQELEKCLNKAIDKYSICMKKCVIKKERKNND